MLIKLFFSVIIVACGALVGMAYGNAYIDRTKLLGSMLTTLQMLETEIVYSATPLPTLLAKLAPKCKKDIAQILLRVVDILDQKEGYTFAEAWKQGVELSAKGTDFKKEDIYLLLSLGNNLGISDREDQVKHIRLTMEELKRNYEQSILEQNKNVKLYKSLGILLGLTLVVIFF